MEEKSRKPEDTPFKQQKLKAWQPILTPNWVIGTFAVVGLIFIPIGIILHTESENVVEYSIQYDGKNTPDSSNIVKLGKGCYLESDAERDTFDVANRGCLITFNIEKEMKAPIFLYYQLDNFYQNHRRYVQSRSDAQLRGDASASKADCKPLDEAKDVIKYNSTATTPLVSTIDKYAVNPCGLIANSLFNGTIRSTISFVHPNETAIVSDAVNLSADIFWVNSLTTSDGAKYYQNDKYQNKEVVNILDQTNIAWKSDVETKFKNIPEASRTEKDMYLWQNPKYRWVIPMYEGQPPVANKTAWTTAAPSYGVQDEHFIVWMRTAGLPSFRKLYGRIDTDLAAGTKLEFLVSSNFLVTTFDGKKSLVISTTSWFGGRNPFLGVAYIVVGSLCMLLAILFFAKHKLSPRKLGDTRYLVWKNNH